MNSSENPLTDQEAMLTAYLDGRLDLATATAFENANPHAAGERVQLEKIRAALSAERPVLRNAEFFNRQILRELAPSRAAEAAPAEAPPRPSLAGLWRMILAGACCLFAAFGIFRTFVPERVVPPVYFAKVLKYKTGDDTITATLVEEDGLTLVKVEGLEPLDEDFILN